MSSAKHRRGWRPGRALAATALAAVALAGTPAVSAAADPADLSASAATATSRVVAAKSTGNSLAQSDQTVLSATGTAPTRVVVKLDYAPLATYAGDVSGYAATAAPRGKFNRSSAASRRYETYISGMENAFTAALRRAVPTAQVGSRLRTVYGGLAVTLPANRARDLVNLPGVVAVQRDGLSQPLTDSSPAFIGAPTLYAALGSDVTAGEGAIVGVLDTGSWPEHPSYLDPGISAAPPRADGRPRVCNFGDNPLTPATDVFVCNDKLISGQPFLDGYNSVYPGQEVYPDSARDSNGHGTHTSTTSGGAPVANAVVLGVDRGAIHGIAPGAHIAAYKVCGANGCFQTDSVAAVGQAIEDGVNVINFSISGGTNPYSDPVELAFLDAYTAGVFVSASAGNDGPTASTVNHVSPWLTSVAASTQAREFQSTLTVTGGGDTFTATGASITAGAGPAPIVFAQSAPGYDSLCTNPAPAGTFTGKIVACERGAIARVEKGYNVLQGGAVGMVLYNPTLADVETDNHWLPAVHLADGTDFVAFLNAHPGATASFTQGVKAFGQGDVMAAFSSRGPGGDFLKPDVTAPGVEILAGHTPTPEGITEGPPGQYFQAIAGTSMSSPHVAGSAALLASLHPDWTPGQIKSALMTTATTDVVKEDTVTPADPFDFGAGRIDLNFAGDPGLTFDQGARGYYQSARFPTRRVDLNIPSINFPALAGVGQTFRTATNVSDQTLTYNASGTATGGTVRVEPSTFTVAPGQSVKLRIRVNGADVAPGQYFGEVLLNDVNGDRDVHLPVAYERTVAQAAVTTTCTPNRIAVGAESTCQVTASNTGFSSFDATVQSSVSQELVITSVEGATQTNRRTVRSRSVTLAGGELGVPSIGPGSLFGYLSLADLGITPTAIGDEEAINYSTAPFTYAGQTYSSLGVTSNGYAVVGGAATGDVSFVPQTLPDPAAPNNVLAPYWTDLDGSGAPGIYAAILSDSTTGEQWFAVEWQENLYGTSDVKTFQLWIGLNGTEDITYAYDPTNLPGSPPASSGLTVGAENGNGTGGDQISGPPTEDLRVTSTEGTAGGSISYSFTARGVSPGVAQVATALQSLAIPTLTTVVRSVQVSAR